MERLKSMKETLMSCAQGQIANLGQVDAEELGAVVDMIKDLDEAIYYCTIVKEMEENKEEKKYAEKHQQPMQQNHYYTIPYYHMMPPYDDYRDWEYQDGRMYYSEGGGRRGYNGGDSGSTNSSGNGNGGRSSSGGGNSSSNSGSSNYNASARGNNARGGGTRGFDEYPLMYEYPKEMRDYREGKSPMSRRGYMESKEMHQGKDKQMRELEKYLTELAQDIGEMVEDASPEEKAMLQQKLSTLATKMK